ncbi:hypothetical protein H4R34_001589 [Dimargaris verticillata]|uniref:Late endosomal/lysosomal adaptor and MAPK and MTOR activator 5 n=1 Tax=Dimargaris verticillata TaxID=2761393 RepID=A0A9W8B868_9FUNG|nr:hypothetical protein H4R34_001589 [Dimargaris verticillata]
MDASLEKIIDNIYHSPDVRGVLIADDRGFCLAVRGDLRQADLSAGVISALAAVAKTLAESVRALRTDTHHDPTESATRTHHQQHRHQHQHQKALSGSTKRPNVSRASPASASVSSSLAARRSTSARTNSRPLSLHLGQSAEPVVQVVTSTRTMLVKRSGSLTICISKAKPNQSPSPLAMPTTPLQGVPEM